MKDPKSMSRPQPVERSTAARFGAALLGAVLCAAVLPAVAQEVMPKDPAAETAQPSAAPVMTPESAVPSQADAPPVPEVPSLSASDATTTPAAPEAASGNDAAQSAPVPSPETAAPSAQAAPPTKSGAVPHDLSPWGMYQAADIVVKSVMIGLAMASFLTWIVWSAKSVELWAAKRRLKGAIRRIATAPNLSTAVETFARSGGTGGALVCAAGEEVVRSLPVLDADDRQGIKERVASRLSRIEANAGRRISFGTGVLATIGSTAPFIGLFGTVWGIMNSFIGIAETQTTNLAVVAPGIAEALLATALGLVAAIPAVMIYNAFARSITGYRMLLADASAGIERLVSWELRSTAPGVHLAQAAE